MPLSDLDHITGVACTDCINFIANGETPPNMTAAEHIAWLEGMNRCREGVRQVSPGLTRGEDGCTCTSETDPDGEYHRENCEGAHHSRAACDHCGSTLDGLREPVTFWLEPETAPE